MNSLAGALVASSAVLEKLARAQHSPSVFSRSVISESVFSESENQRLWDRAMMF
jgi:hypothetical protein